MNHNPLTSIPQTEQELLARAQWLAGFTLGEVAEMLNVTVPSDLKRDKGWVGTLIEMALGAKAGNKAVQDFSNLGIELKTIPINQKGLPLETTFVSLAPLTHNNGIIWESSHVKHKLSHVLWVPVEGERNIPLYQRHIGQAILWSPTPEQEFQLRRDWEELMEMIVLGQLHTINAKCGEVLQLRPKGRNNRSLTSAINAHGEPVQSLPLGFYLRKQFTTEILQNFLHSPL